MQRGRRRRWEENIFNEGGPTLKNLDSGPTEASPWLKALNKEVDRRPRGQHVWDSVRWCAVRALRT